MATTGTVALSNEVKTLYDADFYIACQSHLYWDQLADLKIQMNGQRGKSYEFPIVESLQPSAGALSELEDVVPQQMSANVATVTLQEHGGAIEVTKFVSATSYADVYEQAAYLNGYNLAESLDMVVRAVAGQGSRQFFQNARTSRSAFAGQSTAADRVTPSFIEMLAVLARNIKMPIFDDGSVVTVMHPFVFYDLLQNAGVRDMSIRVAPELLFNGELAYWGGLRILVSPNAKAFWGEGAAVSSSFDTTLAAPANPGDTNLKVNSVTNAAVGQWCAIRDAAEPGNTWSDTNELFRITAVGTAGAGGTGIDGFCFDPGPGDGGGLRYAHPTGTVIRNHNSVYPIPVLGPNSIVKAASSLTGPYGETIVTGPFDRLGRFITFGWYAIVGYARTRNGWILRGEVGSSIS